MSAAQVQRLIAGAIPEGPDTRRKGYQPRKKRQPALVELPPVLHLEPAAEPEPEPPPAPREPKNWRHHPAEPAPADDRSFGQLPAAVLLDREVSDGAARLFAELARHGWREVTMFVGKRAGVVRGQTVAQLAANIGHGRRQTFTHLQQLEQRGHVLRDPSERDLVVYVFGLVGL